MVAHHVLRLNVAINDPDDTTQHWVSVWCVGPFDSRKLVVALFSESPTEVFLICAKNIHAKLSRLADGFPGIR